MATFNAHGSIRIKGTENNYVPIQCIDPMCTERSMHLHCPFCVKTDVYTDPVILKAHYRVKHVDKGIDFAGLKVLRCCDHCDIVGAIKGEKKFRGSHWHCYRCRNGFNRRDEAIKHYKTHFRNPQTTFQIQIVQEVNQMCFNSNENAQAAESLISIDSTIHPALTEAVMTAESASTFSMMPSSGSDGQMVEKALDGNVAANETVGTSEGRTIMIIQETQLDSNLEDSLDVQKHVVNQLRKQLQAMSDSHNKEIEEYKEEIKMLRQQIASQKSEIENYHAKETKLIQELSVSLDDRISEQLAALQTQHTELLHQQLMKLKREYLEGQLSKSNQSQSIFEMATTDHHIDQNQCNTNTHNHGTITYHVIMPEGIETAECIELQPEYRPTDLQSVTISTDETNQENIPLTVSASIVESGSIQLSAVSTGGGGGGGVGQTITIDSEDNTEVNGNNSEEAEPPSPKKQKKM